MPSHQAANRDAVQHLPDRSPHQLEQDGELGGDERVILRCGFGVVVHQHRPDHGQHRGTDTSCHHIAKGGQRRQISDQTITRPEPLPKHIDQDSGSQVVTDQVEDRRPAQQLSRRCSALADTRVGSRNQSRRN